MQGNNPPFISKNIESAKLSWCQNLWLKEGGHVIFYIFFRKKKISTCFTLNFYLATHYSGTKHASEQLYSATLFSNNKWLVVLTFLVNKSWSNCMHLKGAYKQISAQVRSTNSSISLEYLCWYML